jgi:hypothetical protein
MLVAMTIPDHDITHSEDPEPPDDGAIGEPVPGRDPFEEEQVDPEISDPDEATGVAGV